MASTDVQTTKQTLTETDTSEMDGKYLTFWTDKQLFGVPIAHVVQIIGMQAITEIPDFPSYAKGIINLRGSIIPLIDIRLRLGKEESQYNERTCIIVTNMDENDIGFIVDEVDSVVTIADDLIAPPPQISGSAGSYITGVGTAESGVVLLIDARKIVGTEDLSLMLPA